jgi:hypothetical protein
MLLSITQFAFAMSLLAAAKPADIVIVSVVVAIIVITPLTVVTFALMQNQKTQTLHDSWGKEAVELPPGSRVRRYRPAEGVVPPEVAALGQPTQVHEHETLGRALSNAIGGWFGQVPAPPPSDKPTYLAYDQALVAVYQGVYTVIPWDEITEFRHPLGFGISTGQKFPVCAEWKDYGALYDKVNVVIDELVLPRVLETIASGGEAVFRPFYPMKEWETWAAWLGNPLDPDLLGPLIITRQAITYQGKTLPWNELGSLEQIHYRRNGMHLYTALKIGQRGGLLSLWRMNLNSVPNASVLLALFQRLAPRDVLVHP